MLTRKIPGEGATGDDQMTSVVLENVQVLAIDQGSSEKNTEPKLGKTATLQVDQMSAQKLALASTVGRLSLALRNVKNQVIGSSTTVTTADLGGAGMYMAARRGAAPAPMPAPTYYAPAPSGPVRSSGPAVTQPRRPSGPTMTIIRGTDRGDMVKRMAHTKIMQRLPMRPPPPCAARFRLGPSTRVRSTQVRSIPQTKVVTSDRGSTRLWWAMPTSHICR
jgi:hypothetical protein